MTDNFSVCTAGDQAIGFSFITDIGERFIPFPIDFKKDCQPWEKVENQLKLKGIKFFHERNSIFVTIGNENLNLTDAHGATQFVSLLKEQQITINLETIFGEKA